MNFNANVIFDGYTRPDDEEGEDMEDQFVDEEKASSHSQVVISKDKALKAARTLNTRLLNEKLDDAGFNEQETHVIQILISQCSTADKDDALKTALAAERERCCVAVCFMCQNPRGYKPVTLNVGKTWTHAATQEMSISVCRATDIRNLTEQPSSSDVFENPNRRISSRSDPKTPFALPLTSRKSDNGEFYVLDSRNRTIARFSLQKDAEWFVEAAQE